MILCNANKSADSKFRGFFADIDSDGSGTLDRTEIERLASRLGVTLRKKELDAAMEAMDDDGSGEVDFEEFLDWWREQQGEGGDTQGKVSRLAAAALARWSEEALESYRKALVCYDPFLLRKVAMYELRAATVVCPSCSTGHSIGQLVYSVGSQPWARVQLSIGDVHSLRQWKPPSADSVRQGVHAATQDTDTTLTFSVCRLAVSGGRRLLGGHGASRSSPCCISCFANRDCTTIGSIGMGTNGNESGQCD
eukprot:SAG31_NODE_1992_length_6709_cov_3.654870_8_plen_251_part_00